MQSVPVIIRMIRNGTICVMSTVFIWSVKPISTRTEWETGKDLWRKIPLMPKLIWKEINEWWKLLKIILPLFSGRWEMKPETGLILKHAINGSKKEMGAVPYSMNRLGAKPTPILCVRCTMI